MLACVVNISEGRSALQIERLTAAAGPALLDVHSDEWHNRSVFTLAGPNVEQAARDLARRAVDILDLRVHAGAHPRLGVVDVVPFVPIDFALTESHADEFAAVGGLADAERARDAFAMFAASRLSLPCFIYGPGGLSLPEIRKRAFEDLLPPYGPQRKHPRAGACCVGAREVLVAFNVWLQARPGARQRATIEDARRIASELRSSTVRTLAFDLDGHPQVSFNLLEPTIYGPQTAFDAVAKLAPIDRAELVGLMPAAALSQIPSSRWADLDLAEDRTIEARLAKAGFDKEPLPPPPPAPPAWAANGSGPVRPVKPVDERTDDLFDWLI